MRFIHVGGREVAGTLQTCSDSWSTETSDPADDWPIYIISGLHSSRGAHSTHHGSTVSMYVSDWCCVCACTGDCKAAAAHYEAALSGGSASDTRVRAAILCNLSAAREACGDFSAALTAADGAAAELPLWHRTQLRCTTHKICISQARRTCASAELGAAMEENCCRERNTCGLSLSIVVKEMQASNHSH